MKSLLLACPFALVLLLPGYAAGQFLNLGTAENAASWRVTGAGAEGSPAFQVNASRPGEISLTSNGLRNGTFVAGGSLANFNGFWYADYTFFLPADAKNVTLRFDSLYGNDRAVLLLNGTIIGDVDHLGATGAGVFSFPPGPPDVPYTISGTTSGTVTSGFVFGGTNTLRLVVNNTGLVPITAPTSTFLSASDATLAYVNATLTFGTNTPSLFYLYPDSGKLTAGVPLDVYVLALDGFGEILPTYDGEIAFWSTDDAAMLPEPYTFQPDDGGVAFFSKGMIFRTPGIQELYVFDTATFTVFGYAVFEVTGR